MNGSGYFFCNTSWPSSATGFGLERTTTLGAGVAWTAVPGATLAGDKMQVTLPAGSAESYFRLYEAVHTFEQITFACIGGPRIPRTG